MPFPRSATIAATAVLALCAGCVQQPSPSPLPEATPTYSCTPVTGGTPYPCYENQYQETSTQNALYEQAEAVYRKLNAEDERIYRLGGVKEPTAVLLEVTSGEALASIMANYRNLLSDRTRLVSGHYMIASIKHLPSLVSHNSVATVETCIDMSGVVMQAKGEKPQNVGEDSRERAYLTSVDGKLKVSFLEHKWVTKC